jgi:GAF domain-containing protein
MSVMPDSTLIDPKDHLIADLQRQLAECRAERDEALVQQTATSEVLQVINSSPGDLAPVFEAMLEKATRLCDGIQGVLWTINGERVKLVANYKTPPEFVAKLRELERPEVGPHEPLRRIMRGERVLHVTNVAAHELYPAGDPIGKAAIDLSRVGTLVWVALVREGEAVGAFAIARREVEAFSEKQIALLQNFAAQAVIAIENARLLTETREALEQQTATAEVLQVINSSPGNLTPVFAAMLEKAMRLCETAHGNLWTYDGERFHPVAMHGDPRFTEWVRQRGPVPPAPGTILERIVQGERFVHIADAASDEVHTGAYSREAGEVSGARTLLVVPLQKDNALLGAIFAYRQEVRPFSDKQIALFQNFAAQAVIAMENARLITETREALDHQTATAEVLQVINSSPGNLAPVFGTMLEKATDLCDASYGHMWTYDGEYFQPVAFHGEPRFGEYIYQRGAVLPAPASPFDRVLKGERFVHIADALEEPAYSASTGFREVIDVGGIRTQLTVALSKDNSLLGVITAYRQQVQPFSDKEIALLQNFAAQAVIAMENARLLGDLRDRTSDLQQSLEYQTATSDVLRVISRSTFDLQPVLDTLVKTAAGLCNADMAALITRDGDVYQLVADYAVSPEWSAISRSRTWRPGDATVVGRTLLQRRMVHVLDVAAEPRHHPEAVTIGGMRTALGVPLLREGDPIGTIHLARRRVEPFTERQIELVRTFADQAVIAMENARLLGELRRRTEEVAELNRGLEAQVAEQVEELGRVGRLKRFLAPQLAEMIVSRGDEKILESHRREIVVVFCDLRGYTAFTETAEPEEVLDFLREYHGALGPLVSQFEGTLDQFSGDGIMVFFNDPMPIPDPAQRAVKMAAAMREAAGKLIASWRRRRGRVLGFGAGIAQGYATLGQIGFAERSGYTAIGTVCNLAARLCAEAKDGQILLAQPVAVAVEETMPVEEVGELALRGLTQPVVAYNVPLAAGHPALRVIEGGPPNI